MVKNPPTHAGDIRDAVLIPGLGRSPGGGNDNPLQYSMNRGAWWVTVHGVAKSQTRLKQLSIHVCKQVRINLKYLFHESQILSIMFTYYLTLMGFYLTYSLCLPSNLTENLESEVASSNII